MTQPGGSLKSFTYTLDAAGNRTGVSGSGGTESYTLDVLGRITAVTYPNGDTSSYTYDAGGNRLSWTRTGTNGGTTTSTYDAADQLLTEGSVTYTYDGAGNVTAKGGDSFTWDWTNRLTAATVGGTATTFAYDGDDVRVRKTQGATTVNYLWDRQSGLPLLVDDGTTSYVHAGDLQEQESGGTARSPLTDAVGSVRGVADASGVLVGSADYDVFGAVRGTSTTGSSFGFTGEQTDAETGLLFLRSRYYAPGSGRFLSADTVQPNAPGTQGYHLYAYVANNPTTWTDPSGHLAGPIPILVRGEFVYEIAAEDLTVGVVTQLAMEGCALNPTCAPILFEVMVAGGIAAIIAIELIVIWCLSTDACLQFLSDVGSAVLPRTPITVPPGTAPAPAPGPRPSPAPAPQPVPTCGTPGFNCPHVTTTFDDRNCKTNKPIGPYHYLDADPKAPRPPDGTLFSDSQIRRIIEENWKWYGSQWDVYNGIRVWVLYSDGDGRRMLWDPEGGSGKKGKSIDKDGPNAPQVDHICPPRLGGDGSYSNACLLSREENRGKSMTIVPCVCPTGP
jgi:RHS repeat-associated protein